MKSETIVVAASLAAAARASSFLASDLPFMNVGGLSGVAVLDYDNDGFEDLFFAKGNNAAFAEVPFLNNGLFRNDGSGSFEDVSAQAGIPAVDKGMADDWASVVTADFNNDGWTDVFITGSLTNCMVYENLGSVGGVHQGFTQHWFTGENACPETSFGAAAADIDNDSLVDLFVTPVNHPVVGIPDIPTATYMNRGEFVFERVISGAEVGGYPCDASFSDMDDDGDQDLIILGCNKMIEGPAGTPVGDPTPLYLYRNNLVGGSPDGPMFTDATEEVFGGRHLGAWMGTAFGDANRDGLLDLYVGNGGVYTLPDGTVLEHNPHALYINNGDGTFTDRAGSYGVADHEFNWGCTFFDLDNDGFQDLTTVGGVPFEMHLGLHAQGLPAMNPGFVFHNNGDQSFSVSETLGLQDSISSGLARGDFNNDGKSDLVAIRSLYDFGQGPWGDGNPAPLLLINNDDNENHWVKVKLTGVTSNKSGIGAKVTVVARTRSSKFIQAQQVTAGSSFTSTNSPVLTFGLGDARVRRVGVQWPTGELEVYKVPRGSRGGGVTLELVEGEGHRRRLSRGFAPSRRHP